ncbi:hypothetical protein [Roseomonas sp. HF4]|nr:hypothetical protein [Roseomonas sp. HF4]
MPLSQGLLVIMILASCAPPPTATRHHCVAIPNGLVECHEVPPPAPAPR